MSFFAHDFVCARQQQHRTSEIAPKVAISLHCFLLGTGWAQNGQKSKTPT